ncbi:MAG: hypothetical protein EBT70_02315 [Betaproteobacteria bacterium]|nr:hypothetical protein [Betaproteobacteria bacterium]
MKLQPDRMDVQAVTGYGAGWIAINGEKFQRSLIISSKGDRFDWPCQHPRELTNAHFEPLAQLGVEMLIFGSGHRLQFPPPDCLQSLMRIGLGIETMDTQAACRTYNILAGEGRHVAAALIVGLAD